MEIQMMGKRAGVIAGMLLAAAASAYSQTPPPQVSVTTVSASPWSFDFAVGMDNGISGNINSSAVGRLNNQAVVVTKNSYDDVYGTGLHIRFGGGYALSAGREVRATFTLQSLDADLVRMGDIGVSPLYGQYDDYQSFGFDAGLRQYGIFAMWPSVRPYVEGTLGLAFIDETDVVLVAPAYNIGGRATDFYDKTAAFTMGVNTGLMFKTADRISVFGQIGLRWVSGMSEVDDLEGTGLETINDNSARWTFPIIVGLRVGF